MSNRLFAICTTILLMSSCVLDDDYESDILTSGHIPDFEVTLNNGTVLTGSDLSEGLSCIVFFTTTCPDCQELLPRLQRLYEELSPLGVRFAIISREEGEDSIEDYWNANGLTMPYSAQEDRVIYQLFANSGVPLLYICEYGIIKSFFNDNPVPEYEDIKIALS